ncbi:hypothetical protein RIF29_42438 [Crotalaria pallida]|uniref:Uncharacterized protein n=1 Tax=Crotalaria pallida TaxID=3830 RepID=A0AAN9E9U1_CROPI
MVMCKRPLLIVLWLLLFLFIFMSHCQGSRTTNVFKFKPKSQHHGHFFGFLPKRLPIPYSTPSRKHNDIGLKTSWGGNELATKFRVFKSALKKSKSSSSHYVPHHHQNPTAQMPPPPVEEEEESQKKHKSSSTTTAGRKLKLFTVKLRMEDDQVSIKSLFTIDKLQRY